MSRKVRCIVMMGEGLVEVVDAHGAADLLHGLLADTAGFGGAALKDGTHLGQTLLPLGTMLADYNGIPSTSRYLCCPNGCYNVPCCVAMNHLQ